MAVLSHLEPKSVLSWFETICSIPHPSGGEGPLADAIVAFAREKGLEHYRDELNNVIIIKEAAPGYEGEPPIILQGHLDMVCEQEPGRNIDFDTQGLDIYLEDGWITARGTTLGGDDGIAVAYALALLEAEDLPHPRLEVVLTVSEEVGMEGASGINLSMLRGNKVLNLDSEEEGIFTVSCAGGCRLDCRLPLDRMEAEGEICTLTVSGLTGGHSGVEIHKGRANAVRVLTQLLIDLGRQISFSLVGMQGGNKDNAIPRDASAQILLPARLVPALSAALERSRKELTARCRAADPGITISLTTQGEGVRSVLPNHSAQTLLLLIQCLPNGVQAMSEDIPGLVETSLNLGVLQTEEHTAKLRFSLRSSKLAAKEELKMRLYEAMTAVGGRVSFAGDYPPWEYRKDSPLREDAAALYEALYGESPVVMAIHAGLECGILSQKVKDMDAISIGPNMQAIHTTEEKLEVASVRRCWEFILALLAKKH